MICEYTSKFYTSIKPINTHTEIGTHIKTYTLVVNT